MLVCTGLLYIRMIFEIKQPHSLRVSVSELLEYANGFLGIK